MEAVGHRDRLAAIRDPAHQLVALIDDQEEDELAQQVAPAMRQASAEAPGEATDGVDEAAHRVRIVNGA